MENKKLKEVYVLHVTSGLEEGSLAAVLATKDTYNECMEIIETREPSEKMFYFIEKYYQVVTI